MKPIFYLARQWQRIFGRMILIWLVALLAALLIAAAQRFAVGRVYHGGLIIHASAAVMLAGLVDGVIGLFYSGWYRFDEVGYRYHNPWQGIRRQTAWTQVDFLALVPGSMVMSRANLCLMLVGEDDRIEMEYRWERLENLLSLYPGLSIAAYTENAAVVKICRRLADQKISWLPLSWVQHGDGTGELVLRKKKLSIPNQGPKLPPDIRQAGLPEEEKGQEET